MLEVTHPFLTICLPQSDKAWSLQLPPHQLDRRVVNRICAGICNQIRNRLLDRISLSCLVALQSPPIALAKG